MAVSRIDKIWGLLSDSEIGMHTAKLKTLLKFPDYNMHSFQVLQHDWDSPILSWLVVRVAIICNHKEILRLEVIYTV